MAQLKKFRDTRSSSSSSGEARDSHSPGMPRLFWFLLALFTVEAALVWHGRVPGFDRRFTDDLVQRPGAPLFRLGESIGLLGSGGAVVAVSLVIGLIVWRRFRDPILAAVTPVAAGSAGFLEIVCKQIVGRLRPFTAVFTGESGFGFPSGHTTGFTAMVVAATGAFLLLGVGVHRRRTVWSAAAAVSVLVGLGRILVGAHYVLDVTAGLALGGVCSLTVLRVATGELVQRITRAVRRRIV
jgi:undecaprenyl-diphosphatase